jgi:hypothetical protein
MTMKLRRLLVAAAIVVAVAIGGAVPASADGGVTPLGTVLKGENEVPTPGDADGIGVAGLLVSPSHERICYVLAVKRLDAVIAAHIHEGVAGTAPPMNIVVELNAPTRGLSIACEVVAEALATDIAENPENYYVNVHTVAFPAGAIRGQLG